MRNAIGLLIVLWGLSQFFTSSFAAIDDAARESFRAVELAAIATQKQINIDEEL